MKTRDEIEGYIKVIMRTGTALLLRRSTYDSFTTAVREGKAEYEGEDQYGSTIFVLIRNNAGESLVEAVVEFTPQSLEAQQEDEKTLKLREALG